MGQMLGIHIQASPVNAYVAAPTQADRAGGILLLHDIWGLDDHTKNVADRLAAQGYHVLAPDLISGSGLEKFLRPELQQQLFSPSNRQRSTASAYLANMTKPLYSPQMATQALIRAHACFEYLYNQAGLRQRVSVMGFGLGGGHCLSLSIRDDRISAGILFYARASYVAWELRHIQCPLISFYGRHDNKSFASLLRLQPQMQQAGVNFDAVVYDEAGEYFFNNTLPAAYDEHDASDAWSRSMSFLRKNMG